MGHDSRERLVTFTLECVECGDRSDAGQGWKAFLDDESLDVWVYCADCAHREFEAG